VKFGSGRILKPYTKTTYEWRYRGGLCGGEEGIAGGGSEFISRVDGVDLGERIQTISREQWRLAARYQELFAKTEWQALIEKIKVDNQECEKRFFAGFFPTIHSSNSAGSCAEEVVTADQRDV